MTDPTKETYRPKTADDLDAEIDAAIGEAFGDASLDDLLGGTGRTGVSDRAVGGVGGDGGSGVRVARVVSVDRGNNDVMVDLGGKNQGLIPLDQFDDNPPAEGDEVEVEIERFDSRESLYLLRRRGAATGNLEWSNLHPGQIVEGLVTKMNKGGLEVQIGTLRAFMPAGQVDTEFHEDLNVFVGQRVKAEVTKADRSGRNLVLSRRAILERERADRRQTLLKDLAIDQVRRGVVKRVTEFGAFVDLGGMDGLLHVSEMSHNRHAKASELVNVGDLVDVQVLKFDAETGRMSLSLKSLMADPWKEAERNYPVGSVVSGRVTKVENFGAFIELEEGLEGLLPVSEMSWQRVRHPSDAVANDQMLRLVVIALDSLTKKITLSLKQAGVDPWNDVTNKYPKQTVVPAKVTRIADFGAFVELEPGLEGLVHISELSDKRVRTVGDVVRPGQDVSVRVLDADPQTRRMSLSMKQANERADPSSGAGASNVVLGASAPPRKRPTNLRGGLDR